MGLRSNSRWTGLPLKLGDLEVHVDENAICLVRLLTESNGGVAARGTTARSEPLGTKTKNPNAIGSNTRSLISILQSSPKGLPLGHSEVDDGV